MNNHYLERQFIDALNYDGIVEIWGSQFDRDYILYNLDKEAYDNAFTEWLDDYRNQKLAKAEQLLNLYRNRDRFNRLKAIFKNGQVIPFIGAGLSKPTGLPLWKEFLKNVQRESSIDSASFDNLLDTGDFENAAQLLANHSQINLQEHLDNIYGKEYALNEIDGVVCRLPEFFTNCSIITTNYDDLLKIAYENANQNFAHYLIGLDATEFPRLLSSGQKILLQLHGTYTTKNKRILTTEDYDRHYNENNTISNCIYQLFSKSILFLGCSLSVDRTIKTLQEIVSEKGSDNLARHYAFLPLDKMSDTDRIKRQEELAKANIFPIWYDDDHDECIEALLELLIEGR